ncbi:MAG: multicopper oxidase domain-containing protein [Gammaproteobacteria bacterium]|nr:multicopper oxidase domain-containing protein [Gammaproteobacteria bacterium]
MKRRSFLKTTGYGTAGFLLPGLSFAQGGAGTFNPLKIPGLLTGTSRGSVKHYDLKMQTGLSNFLPGLSTPTFGINGNFLGPTIRFRDGDDVAMHVENTLGEASTLHWHGMHVPAAADGGPHQVVKDGSTWNPEFQIRQKSGTFWYHSHLVSKTGEQVYKGLAGMIIIDDEESRNASIPSEYGVDDIPLVVQDRRFNEDGSFQYLSSHRDIMMGFFADTILVNGTASPYFVPTTKKVRFRFLNGSNARTYNFAFSDDRRFRQLSCDGGFLERHIEMSRLVLAPGERCDIVVDFSDGNPVDLISLPLDGNSPFLPRGMMRNMYQANTPRFNVLAIRPQSNLANSEELPQQLTAMARLDEGGIDRVRAFTLGMAMGMGMMGGGRGPGGGGRGMMRNSGEGEFSINGRSMDMAVINETIPLGSKEIWEITNDTMMMHPFHVHHGQFQVLDRNGVSPSAHERAFKDTVKVGPGEKVRIIMEFEDFSDPNQPYMYHCHILEHEDNGMMGQFVIV